jgi:sigma-B regulation protein RsbU (phosphoserine phosphatase)
VDTSTSRSASRLEALLESAQLLHSSLEVDELARHLLRSVMGRLVIARGFVALDEGGEVKFSLVRGFKQLAAGQTFEERAAREAGVAHLVPIGDAERPLGILGLGAPASGKIDPSEDEFLQALAAIAATGIANARAHDQVQRLNRHLDHKIHELKTLLELVRALTEAEGPEDVAHLLGLTLAGQWAVGRFAVAASKPGHPPVMRQKGTALVWQPGWARALRDLTEPRRVVELPPGELRDALLVQRLDALFPLRSAVETFGFAAVGPRPGNRPFVEAELELGAGLVAQSVVAFENAWHQREVLEKKQIERELALAASIQRNLFPAQMPTLDRCVVAAVNRPARQVGGDYYDALTDDSSVLGGRWLFCVADVSGKGISASLLMSNIQATLRALLGREASLAELTRCINDLMFTSTPGNRYVTALLFSIDPATGHCVYVNAGHTEGLILRAGGEVDYLKGTGVALGMFPGMVYEERGFELGPGDLLALYSDGVTEALNLDDEEFGVDSLIDSLRRVRDQAPAAMVDAVLRDVDRFAGDAPQYDDITLMLLKRS